MIFLLQSSYNLRIFLRNLLHIFVLQMSGPQFHQGRLRNKFDVWSWFLLIARYFLDNRFFMLKYWQYLHFYTQLFPSKEINMILYLFHLITYHSMCAIFDESTWYFSNIIFLSLKHWQVLHFHTQLFPSK